MAIGWMTALKLVPWSDVIENAPTLVNGARKLFTKTKAEASEHETAPPATTAAATRTTQDPAQQFALLAKANDELAARVGSLEGESRDAAALVQQLAEQQQTMVVAIEALRRQGRVLGIACGVLAVACVALGATFLMK